MKVASTPIRARLMPSEHSTTITEVQTFHGLANFYRKFIRNFRIIMAPITECLKQKTFIWHQLQKKSFNNIKSTLCQSSILCYTQLWETHSSRGGCFQVWHRCCPHSRRRTSLIFQWKLSELVEIGQPMNKNYTPWCELLNIGNIT